MAGLYSGDPASLYGSDICKGINDWRKQVALIFSIVKIGRVIEFYIPRGWIKAGILDIAIPKRGMIAHLCTVTRKGDEKIVSGYRRDGTPDHVSGESDGAEDSNDPKMIILPDMKSRK